MATITIKSPMIPKTGIWGERNMRWYLGGQLISLTGSMLQSAVLSLLIIQIKGKTDAAYYVGIVWALGLVPGIFLAPFAGLLLDRWDKRKILIVTGVFGILQALILAYLTNIDRITILEINVLALLMGIVNAIDGPGRNAIVKDAVSQGNVRQASKLFTALYSLAQVAGPGFAGWLVIRYGYTFTFILNAFSFAALVVALIKMKFAPEILRTTSAEMEKDGTWKLVVRGANYILEESGILLGILLNGVICTFGFSYYAILAIISRDMFGGNPIVYSHLAAASGIGSFFGTVIIVKFDKHFSHKFLVVANTLLLGAGTFALAMTRNLTVAAALLFLIGFSFMACFSTLRSSIIHLAKKEMTGIVIGFTFSFFYGGMMLGSFGAGWIANRWNCSTELIVCGIALGITGTIIPFLPSINAIDKKQ